MLFQGVLAHKGGGIVLEFEKHMNQVLELDRENMAVVIQSAVINKHLQNFVKEEELFHPPDPASEDYSTIRRNVAEMRAV